MNMQTIANGVYQFTLGTPEPETPSNQSYRLPPKLDRIGQMPQVAGLPWEEQAIKFSVSPRGCLLELPLTAKEDLYGFGLQLKSLRQTGKKRSLRVNSDPVADTGDSHAPVPLYFSTAGYGILFDTLRYINVYTGGNSKVSAENDSNEDNAQINLTEAELYRAKTRTGSVYIEIPHAQGIRCVIFGGPTLRNAVERYNLFAGGGCMMPEWALGVWYRSCGKHDQDQVLSLAEMLRQKHIPCDVLGLEPGWQSHAYSCSLAWSTERFPDYPKVISRLNQAGYKINLWEHAFIHPSSPLYAKLKPYSGDFAVWEGLVPDLTISPAKEIFSEYHRQQFVDQDVISFKLDECDNSDFIASPWSFPECSRFPSGKDGEQMHSAFGLAYQSAVHRSLAGTASCHSVRSAHLFASPYPFVLYSDLYDHADFIRGVTTAGFSGLLWCPELRHAKSVEDYLRRLQSMILSPQMLLNIWAMPHPPWAQLNRELNVAGELYDEDFRQHLESETVVQLRQRMTFIPYLLAAFARYHTDGVPPFRALIMDYPQEQRLRDIDFAWLAGESLLVVPLRAGESSKTLPLPPGNWYDFYTGKLFNTEATVAPPVNQLAILVRENSVVPLWDNPPEYTERTGETHFRLELRRYGKNCPPFQLGVLDKNRTDVILSAEIDAGGILSGEAAGLFSVARITDVAE